jgi:hypothetical protein
MARRTTTSGELVTHEPMTLVEALAVALDWIQRADDDLTCEQRGRQHEQIEAESALTVHPSDDSLRAEVAALRAEVLNLAAMRRTA